MFGNCHYTCEQNADNQTSCLATVGRMTACNCKLFEWASPDRHVRFLAAKKHVQLTTAYQVPVK